MIGSALALAMAVNLSGPVVCAAPVAVDGDTIKCARGVTLRMSGIDTPEMPGHCRAGRVCVPGDGPLSKASLQKRLDKGRVRYWYLMMPHRNTAPTRKTDLYGRLVVIVKSGVVNLSCWQLKNGQAQYVPNWDSGKFVKTACKL